MLATIRPVCACMHATFINDLMNPWDPACQHNEIFILMAWRARAQLTGLEHAGICYHASALPLYNLLCAISLAWAYNQASLKALDHTLMVIQPARMQLNHTVTVKLCAASTSAKQQEHSWVLDGRCIVAGQLGWQTFEGTRLNWLQRDVASHQDRYSKYNFSPQLCHGLHDNDP